MFLTYDIRAVTFPCFCILFTYIPFLGTLTWFLSDIHHDRSCLAWPERHFEKVPIEIIPRFDIWRHTAIFFTFSVIYSVDFLLIIFNYFIWITLLQKQSWRAWRGDYKSYIISQTMVQELRFMSYRHIVGCQM